MGWAVYRDYLALGNLRPSKILNAARYLLAKNGSARLAYRPLYYMVETGNVCKLRCPFCIQGHYDPRLNSEKRLLRYDEFLVILRKIRPYALILDLFKHGEPLLNADLGRMIRAATAAGVRCRVNSALNAPLDAGQVREICQAGLYKLNCAIDGVTQDVYARYRVNGSLELALETAAKFLAARRWRRPVMVFRMLVFEWNHHQVGAARALAERMGFDEFAADPGVFEVDGNTVVWDIAERRWRPAYWPMETIVPGQAAVQAPPKAARPCPSLFRTLVLHADGPSMVCCHANQRGWQHLSLLDHSLEEVWNSEEYVRTREYALGLSADRDAVFAQCRGCGWL